ncbi:peptidylprolyl isomerase [candidate division KSB1 bacterium]|nr:peptidylprolyl isomerase [candidate division KSB1 bacterium]
MKQNLYRIGGIGLLVLLVVLCVCGNREDKPVAKVGDRVITLGKFETEFMRGKAPNVVASAKDSVKLAHLNTMIEDELKILEAYAQKLDEDSVLVTEIKNREKNEVGRRVWEKEVLEKVIPDSEVREFYVNSQKEVHARDILLRATDKDSAEVIKRVEDQINKIYDDLKSGAKFDSLARRYSQDRGTAPKGGDRGFLKWIPNMSDNELYRVAFELNEGELSKPFRMSNGFHIIKVEEVKPLETQMGPYEKEKDKIRRQFMGSRSKEIQEGMDKFTEVLKKKYDGKLFEDNIKAIAAKLKEAKAASDTTEEEPPNMAKQPIRPSPANDFSVLSPDDLELPLFKYDGGEISVGRIINEVKGYPPGRQPNLGDAVSFAEYLKRVILVELYVHEGYQRGYDQEEEVEKQFREQIESSIKRVIYQQNVLNVANPADDALMAYYEVNKQKYMHPERRDVQEIWIKGDRKKAEAVLRDVKVLKKDFSSVARKYNERAFTKKKDGRLGLIRDNQYGAVGKEAFKMKANEISDIVPMGNNYSIIKLLEIIEPQMKTYDEVKYQVRNEVLKQIRTQKENEWMAELKKKYKVIVYDNLLKEACKNEE